METSKEGDSERASKLIGNSKEGDTREPLPIFPRKAGCQYVVRVLEGTHAFGGIQSVLMIDVDHGIPIPCM